MIASLRLPALGVARPPGPASGGSSRPRRVPMARPLTFSRSGIAVHVHRKEREHP